MDLQITKKKICVTCNKCHVQGALRGQFPGPPYPFHTICMDFIELNKCENKKYCLVIVFTTHSLQVLWKGIMVL